MGHSSKGSVSRLIADLKAGDKDATRLLWERYYQSLVNYARQLLDSRTRRVVDEEDVAVIAFNSFFKAVQAGRFPKLDDRNDLWQILLMLTARKAADEKKYENRRKRGGGKVRGDSGFATPDAKSGEDGIEQVIALDPTPEVAAAATEELARLLDALGDETLRRIACLKMEGYTNAEIGRMLHYVEKSVERKLRLIRQIWLRERPQ